MRINISSSLLLLHTLQSSRFETRKFAAGRKEQHQNCRFRYGFTATGRFYAGNLMWIAALCMSRGHKGKCRYTYIANCKDWLMTRVSNAKVRRVECLAT